MQPFEIIQERPHGLSAGDIKLGTWSIRQSGRLLTGLAWDEMLGGTARCLLNGCEWPSSAWARDELWDGFSLAWSFSVAGVGPLYGTDWWVSEIVLREGDRFSGRLTPSEAIGFIALYTSSNRERALFGGMKTYEEWARVPYNARREIAGFLTHQGGAA